jgi:hypothetical protein
MQHKKTDIGYYLRAESLSARQTGESRKLQGWAFLFDKNTIYWQV